MEQITKMIIYDNHGKSVEIYTKYPFPVNIGDLFDIESFIDNDIQWLMNEDTLVVIEDCGEVDHIRHKMEGDLYYREINFIHPFLELPDYRTEIKDGKVHTYTLDELRTKNNKEYEERKKTKTN